MPIHLLRYSLKACEEKPSYDYTQQMKQIQDMGGFNGPNNHMSADAGVK